MLQPTRSSLFVNRFLPGSLGMLAVLCGVFLPGAVGCKGRVFRHTGAMNMGGGMNMTGDMTVDGKLDMGELQTSITMNSQTRATPLSAVVVSGNEKSVDRVAILDVDDLMVDRNIGGIGSSGENPTALFREKVRAIRDDPAVKAVVVRINSPGGGVTASDIMCHELAALKTQRDIPVIASIMVVGTGGAYYLANHCDIIMAHPTSIVGGIGVILNVYNLEDTMGQFNILSASIKSGEKIDAGSPERPIEEDELEMLQGIADTFHKRFITQVESRRPELQAVQQHWADGSVMTGAEAQSLGLVDQIGYVDTAIELAKQSAGLSSDVPVVLYRRDSDPAYTALDITPNQPAISSLLPLHIPGLDRSTMPTFLYMWQADPKMASTAHP